MYAFTEYQAASWSLDECQNVMKTIDETLVRKDVRLNSSRWFDYRLIHPVKLTDLFYAILQEENVRYTSQNIDKFEADCLETGKCAFDEPKRFLNTIVKARHMADSFGIPYRFFIRALQDFHSELNFTGKVPPPSYFYKMNVGEELILAFKEAAVVRRYAAETEHFEAKNYVGRREQEEYIDWMTSVCNFSDNPSKHLLFFKDDKKHFPIDAVEDSFGNNFVK